MTTLSTLRSRHAPGWRAVALWAAVAAALAPAASAQDPTAVLPGEVDARGTAYYVFTEPGAPTVRVVMVGEGVRNGVYRLETGTTLVQALALAGGTTRSDSTEQAIRTTTVSVLRDEGGARRLIYRAPADRVFLEPEQHPALQTGDVINVNVEYEAVRKRVTVLQVFEVAGRVASLVSLVYLVARGGR